MRSLIKHRWPLAICGPVPTALWALCITGCVLTVMTEPGGTAYRLSWITIFAGLGLACTTMALASHRRSERYTREAMADAALANNLLVDRLLSEFNARLAGLGIAGQAEPDVRQPSGVQAAWEEQYFAQAYRMLRPEDSGDHAIARVVPMHQRKARRAS